MRLMGKRNDHSVSSTHRLVVSDAAPGAREAIGKQDLPGQGTADMLVGATIEVVIGHDVEVEEVYR